MSQYEKIREILLLLHLRYPVILNSQIRLPDKLVGVLLASSATALGGGTVVLTRLIIEETDSLSLAMIRYGLAALFLLGILLVTTRIPRMARRDLAILAVFGVVMFSGFPFFMTRALEDTTCRSRRIAVRHDSADDNRNWRGVWR